MAFKLDNVRNSLFIHFLNVRVYYITYNYEYCTSAALMHCYNPNCMYSADADAAR